MKSRFSFFTLIFIVVILTIVWMFTANAQHTTGGVKGKIVSSDGDPVVSANVLLKEIARGGASSELGVYEIQHVPQGTYTLIVSSIGYATFTHSIEIRAGQTLTLDVTLPEEALELPAVVVTGTRNEKIITNVPIPTSVITEKQIAAQSAVRLNDLLAEQPGMFIVYNQFGTGIQVEGLDPAYTLILLDGEPIVGRSAGTLDLTRLSLANIQRVEVVKGPSSSLYGSDALAAVINLITRPPTDPLKFSLSTRYGSHNTLDMGGGIETTQGTFGASLFIEWNSSDGYDLYPETIPQTAPHYTNYSANPKLVIDLGEDTKASLTGRIVTQHATNIISITTEETPALLNERSALLDWSLGVTLSHEFEPGTRLETRLYRANYKTDYSAIFQSDGTAFDETSFKLDYVKAEAQFNTGFSETFFSIFGTGYISETAIANRISGDEHSNSSQFAFAQQEWIPSSSLDFIASIRYDAHQEYASRLTPKISALVKPFDWLSIRASIGSGFKAPTFQQLYLDFTNPQVGYSVYGSSTVRESFAILQQSGQVESVLKDPSTLELIQPENSLAYSAGVELRWGNWASLKTQIFRNQLQDLIEAAPFAMKTNGQAVFTYFNIHRVFTQGLDAEITLKPLSELVFTIAYQYLEAKDENALNDVRAGKIFKIGSTGRVRPVQEAEYGGLFNRSAHSGTIKFTYNNTDAGFSANLRGILRSRVGFTDMNGNTILDDDSEYAPGYAFWNITLSQTVFRTVTIQAGVENIFDKTVPAFFPSLPGRILYARFSYEYN